MNTELKGRRVVPDLIVAPERRGGPPMEIHSPVVARRVAVLEREAPAMVDLARSVGVEIKYEGIAPMFEEPVIYAGNDTDWIIGPMGAEDVPVIPREQQKALALLDEVGARFPVLYVAHEVEKGSFPGSPEAPTGTMAVVSTDQAADIIGPPPLPPQSVELANRLSERSAQVFRAIRTAGVVAGTAALAVAAAPVALVGAAAGALATLDPIVIGVIPAVPSPTVGAPAAWYELTRWDW